MDILIIEEFIMPYPPISQPYINTAVYDEMLSAKTFDLKKLNSRDEYKLCIVPTISQLVAGAPTNKAVVPEVLNYLRYTAAIRALQHNCKFIHKAIRATTPKDLCELTTLTYDYKNARQHNGIRCSNRRVHISPSGFYLSALNILEDSKQIIQNLENLLILDKLSNTVPNFDKTLTSTTKLKDHYIEYADELIKTISNNKDIFNNFVSRISKSSSIKAEPKDSILVK